MPQCRPSILRSVVLLALCAATIGISARSDAVSAATSSKSLPALNLALVSDINTLDPAVSSSFYDRQIMNNIYDKLFDLNSKGHVIPMLALKYTPSKDRLTYTITLRKGVKFQDGTPFNAAAVKFNLDRYRQPSSAPRAVELQPVSSVTTSGNYTVKIHLSLPFSPLIAYLTDRSGMMASPKAVQDEGTGYAQAPVGTGPFKLQERVKGDHITLVRNPGYWRKGYPKASSVTFKIFADPNVQLVNLQSGAVDFNDSISAANVGSVQHDKKFAVTLRPSYSWGGFWLNTKAAALSDHRVREAISLAINRAQYVKVACGKTCFAANSPYGPGLIGYGSWDKAHKPDVKSAKKLLAQAHASNPSFTFVTVPDPIAAQNAALLQSDLAAAGITMKITTENFPSILNDLQKHNFEAAAVGWSGRPDPDLNSYNHFYTGAPNNYGQYSNPKVDKYLNLGRHSVDPKKRQADYEIVARQLAIDAPYIFLDHGNVTWAYSKKLKGVQYVPDGIIRAVAMTK